MTLVVNYNSAFLSKLIVLRGATDKKSPRKKKKKRRDI